MYKLIQAKEEHVEQLIPLIFSTSYWRAIRQNNKLHKAPEMLLKEHILKAYLPFTTVAVSANNETEVFGLVICFPNKAYETMPNGFQHFNAGAAKLIAPLSAFPTPDDGFEIKVLAVAKNKRGNGIGQALFNHAELQAREAGFEKLFLFMHSCQNEALRFYLKNGMMIRNVIILDEIFPAKEMLYLEKTPETKALLEHFDTKASQELKLFDHDN